MWVFPLWVHEECECSLRWVSHVCVSVSTVSDLSGVISLWVLWVLGVLSHVRVMWVCECIMSVSCVRVTTVISLEVSHVWVCPRSVSVLRVSHRSVSECPRRVIVISLWLLWVQHVWVIGFHCDFTVSECHRIALGVIGFHCDSMVISLWVLWVLWFHCDFTVSHRSVSYECDSTVSECESDICVCIRLHCECIMSECHICVSHVS